MTIEHTPSPYAPPLADMFAPVAKLENDELIYAGFWMRFVAVFLDNLIVGFLSMIVMIAGFFAIGMTLGIGDTGKSDLAVILIGAMWGTLLLMRALYFILLEGSAGGATLGKRAMGLTVCTSAGAPLSKWHATARYFAHLLSYLTLYIGYFIQPFTERKQALHDLITDTVVVVKPRD